MAKLLFIVPSNDGMGDYAKKMRKTNATIPYGVLSITTFIKCNAKKNHEIRILDLNAEEFDENTSPDSMIEDSLISFAPDFVGISAAYNFLFSSIIDISRIVKRVLPQAFLFAGGACTTSFYKELLLDNGELDAICFSEGETPILQLLEGPDFQEVVDRKDSFITRTKLQGSFVPKPDFIDDLDEIPLVDFNLLDMSKYGIHRHSYRPDKTENDICLPIHTTRGCPFNCVFCIASSLHGKKVRKMSVERVIRDVQIMKEEYGMNVLSIEDDQFLIDRDRTLKILKGLAEEHISIRAESGLTISYVDEEIAEWLKKAGMEVVYLAIESGSDYVLKEIIDKPINIQDVKTAVKNCRKQDIIIHCFLVIGFPGERESDRQETIDMIIELGIDWSYITCATPVRGSRLYDICLDKGYIDANSLNENAYYVSIINTPEFTSDEITRRAYLMNLELNFMNNHRMKIGDYHLAIGYFSDILSKYPDHAFAQYFAAKAHREIGEMEKYRYHRNEYCKIVNQSREWADYARHFHLQELKQD